MKLKAGSVVIASIKDYRNSVSKNSTAVGSPVQNHNWTASNEYS